MGTINVNGIGLYYEVHGKGKPVLFIAGLMSDSRSWESVVGLFAKKYQVILVDNRGVGRTTPMDVDSSIELIARDCISLLDHLNLDKVDVVGHSMGGFVGLELAATCPDRVGNLVLVATAAKSSERNNILFDKWVHEFRNQQEPRIWFEEVFSWIFTKELLSNADIKEMFLEYAINDPYSQSVLALAKQGEAIKNFDFTGRENLIKSRTLILSGEKDRLFSVEESVGSLKGIAGAASIVIKDAPHAIHAEKNVEFFECVSDFIG